MVRKSKRKQSVVPFERNSDAVSLDLSHCIEFLTLDENDADTFALSNVLRSLTECESILQQTKVLQENKTFFKSIIGKDLDGRGGIAHKKAFSLLLHVYLEPSYFPLRKSIEWIGEAICRSSALSPIDLRSIVREIGSGVLTRALDSGELVGGSMEECLHWVFTFSSMVLLDKEIHWLDDSVLDQATGVWTSDVWPATNLLGEGSLLILLQAMTLVLQRCTAGMISMDSPIPTPTSSDFIESGSGSGSASASASASDSLRYSECVGECMRVLSAVLKSRRKAIIPRTSLLHSTFASPLQEDDMWGQTATKIISYGCQLLSCENCNKDILTQAALSVISVQWLLRERLWATASSGASTPHPYSGYQLVSILSLLNLNRYISTTTSSSATHGEGGGSIDSSSSSSTGQVQPGGDQFASAVGVHCVLIDGLIDFSSGGITMLARVALLRACISVFDRRALMWPDDFEHKLEKHLIAGKYNCLLVEKTETIEDDVVVLPGLLLGPIIEQIVGFVQTTDPTVQVYALQTLETWLGRVEAEGIGKNSSSGMSGLKADKEKNMRTLLLRRLYNISQLLCRTWSHPHKLISHVVPAIFQRVIDLLAAIESKMTSRDAINTPDYDDIWYTVLSQTLQLPPEHRGRYQALSALLPRIGARRFLHVQPDIIQSLVLSMRIRDVSSSVSQFMGSFLASIKTEKNINMPKMRSMYTKDVVNVLCSSEKTLRLNGNDYLLQELMKLDPDGCGPSLINQIRSLGDDVPAEHRLWGLVSVALQARLLSRPGGEIDFGIDVVTTPFSSREKSELRRNEESGKSGLVEAIVPAMAFSALKSSEVMQACLSDDVNLRLATLTLLVASQRTVAPLNPLEMNILQEALPYSLKSHVADHRQRVLRVLRLLVTRLFETHRSKVKEVTKSIEHRRKTAFAASGVALTPLHISAGDILNHVTEDELETAQVIKDIHQRVEWLNGVIVSNLYPGAPNEKQIMALEMLKCIIDGLSNDTNNHSNKSQLVSNKGLKGSKHPQKRLSAIGTADGSGAAVTCDDTLIYFFFTESITTCLLNLLLSSWDRTRSLASEVILKLLPTPWPGYDEAVMRKKTTKSSTVPSLSLGRLEDTPSTTTTSSTSPYQSGKAASRMRMATLEDESDADAGAPSHKTQAVATKSNEKVLTLFRMGCDLVGSPRHRNADNGALLLRVVMNVYSLHLQWSLHCPTASSEEMTASDLVHSLVFLAPSTSMSTKSGNGAKIAGVEESRVFIETLCRILDQRLGILHDAFRSLFGQDSGSKTTTVVALDSSSSATNNNKPISIFSHGVVLALRYCIEDIDASGVFADLFNKDHKVADREVQVKNWVKTIRQVLALCLRALQIAMLVVAEAPSDTYFAPMPNAEKEKEFMLVVDPNKKMKNMVNNNPSAENKEMRGYASDSFMMNTNIFMDIDDEGNSDGVDGEGGASNGQQIQHAVVGAWLLVKESCALLAKLVQISLSASKDKSTPLLDLSPGGSEDVLITTDDIAGIGGVILDALSRLKHNGAIAEAQVALQSVCESVLRHTTSDTTTGNALYQLPKTWIESLFAKLRGEQKASILRRSAGFAFSFLSLLRSEPKNCRPVLLPLAMEKLFYHAVNGNGIESSSVVTSEEDKWRSIVHALNIIRLIILDATLGPDLYPYIAEATKIAVRGFKSDRWAVRNSSMMVFSAVVQRAVDNDKKENGGVRAATPEEFFGRFPTLYPFFVIELADIVQRPLLMDTKLNWPVAVGESRCERSAMKHNLDGSMAVHPSLYPILLMLSKMKTTFENNENAVVVQGSVGCGELNTMFDKAPAAINVSLFIPLVEECCDQQLYHVRVMAAKALASLVPLSLVSSKVTAILKEFRDMFCTMYDNHTLTKAPTRQHPLSSNLLHGMLLQVLELLSNARKLVCGTSSELGDNKTLSTTLLSTLQDHLVPELCNIVDALRVVIVKYGGKSDFLQTDFPPAMLLTLTRIFRVVHDILKKKATKLALEDLCKICFSDLLEGSECHSQSVSLAKRSQYALEKARIPLNPLLWKECITEMIQFSGEKVISELMKVLSPSTEVTGDDAFTSKVCEALSSFYALKQYLEFPVSEVREGVIIGCGKILEVVSNAYKTNPLLVSKANKSFLFNNLFVCYHQDNQARQSHSNDEVGLLNQLLRRFLQETEPPILEATLELLEKISCMVSFVDLSDITSQEAFTDSIPQFLQVVCGTYRADTMLDIMDPTTRTAFTSADMAAEDDHGEHYSIAPTMSAAYAINILGWVMGGFFSSAIVLVDDLKEQLSAVTASSTTIQSDAIGANSEKTPSKHMTDAVTRKFFSKFSRPDSNVCRSLACVGPEGEGQHTTYSGRKSDEEDNEASFSIPTATSENVWSWLRLLEMTVGEQPESNGEIAQLDARLSTAQSLLSSGVLKWAVLQSSVTLKLSSGVVNEWGARSLESLLGGGCGDFATRVWLVALRLLQDDDVDVRFHANSAVSEANSLTALLLRDLVSFPALFPSPEQTSTHTTPHTPSQGQAISVRTQQHKSQGCFSMGTVSTVEGRSIEGLATSLSVSLACAVLSDARNGKSPGRCDSHDILSKWMSGCGVPEQTEVHGVEKIFEADENNSYEEGVLTCSALASSLVGSLLFLLPLTATSIATSSEIIWKNLIDKATCVVDFLRTDLNSTPVSNNDHQKKYIGTSSSHEDDSFQRLFCGLSGVARLVTCLGNLSRMSPRVSDQITTNVAFMGAMLLLRANVSSLLMSLHHAERAIHPLLIGQLHQISVHEEVFSMTLMSSAPSSAVVVDITPDVAMTMDSSRGKSRLASSYGGGKRNDDM